MGVPWMRLLDGVLGLRDVMRAATGRPAFDDHDLAAAPRGLDGLETRLAGVVVAALKEAFDRDHQRMELERQQIEAERARAERALRLELLRQAGDREIGRMRLVAGVALASWLGTLFLASRLLTGSGGRVTLGIGWLLLLVAMAMAFMEQSRLGRALAVADERLSVDTLTTSGAPGTFAPWLVVGGLASTALGVLIS